jgi:hypothetical protein
MLAMKILIVADREVTMTCGWLMIEYGNDARTCSA